MAGGASISAGPLQWLFDVSGSSGAERSIDEFLAGFSSLVMGSPTYEWLLRAIDSSVKDVLPRDVAGN